MPIATRYGSCMAYHGVIYQVYPSRFADGNDDGIGDLWGVAQRADYFARLGVDMVWFNPVSPSGGVDGGYDVTDYEAIDEQYGGEAAWKAASAALDQHGIGVMVDLVLNHTSDQHPWFLHALNPDSPYHDWYVWHHGDAPPNNWISMFGGSAWSQPTDIMYERAGLTVPVERPWYLHNFAPEQPDLNYLNSDVVDETGEIIRRWCARGIAGVRLDACHAYLDDALREDNPPATEDDRENIRARGQQPLHNMNRAETAGLIETWRTIADEYGVVLYGEARTMVIGDLSQYHPGLELALNQHAVEAQPHELPQIANIIETVIPQDPRFAPSWTWGNHDTVRLADRWDIPTQTAMLILLTLRGSATIYQGDELGARQSTVTVSSDPIATTGTDATGTPVLLSRDGCRAAMPWGNGWGPIQMESASIPQQIADTDSPLRHTTRLLQLRKDYPQLATAAYIEENRGDVWQYRRDDLLVTINFGESPIYLEDILYCTQDDEPMRHTGILSTTLLQPGHGAISRR